MPPTQPSQQKGQEFVIILSEEEYAELQRRKREKRGSRRRTGDLQ